MIKAPNGHTSIYFCPYIKRHWKQFNKMQTNHGFKSFNSFVNNALVNMLKQSPTTIRNTNIDVEKRLNPYDDSKSTIKEKLKSHSDGEAYDVFKLITEMRDTVISDLERRGMKL